MEVIASTKRIYFPLGTGLIFSYSRYVYMRYPASVCLMILQFTADSSCYSNVYMRS